MTRIVGLLIVALCSAGAFAQSSPIRPIPVIVPAASEYFSEAIRKDIARWGKLARDFGFKPR